LEQGRRFLLPNGPDFLNPDLKARYRGGGFKSCEYLAAVVAVTIRRNHLHVESESGGTASKIAVIAREQSNEMRV
jgi:hypothetical protein